MGNKVEPYAPHPGVMKVLKLSFGHVALHHGDAAVIARAGPERINHRPVVGPMAACLNDH